MRPLSKADLERYIRSDYQRRVRIPDNLTIGKAEDVAAELRRLDNESAETIVLEFTSNGGTHESAVLLAAENMAILRSPTLGVVYGKCFSAGFTILQMCTWRYALPSARFLMHNNRVGFQVTPNLDPEAACDQLRILIERQKEIRRSMISIISRRLDHYTNGELIKMMDRADEDGPITAEDALHRRMIDEILNPLPAPA